MPPCAKLFVDIEVQSAGGCDCRNDSRERLVTSERPERLDPGVLLQLGELVRAYFAEEPVDVVASALERETDCESSPFALGKFFGLAGFTCSTAWS